MEASTRLRKTIDKASGLIEDHGAHPLVLVGPGTAVALRRGGITADEGVGMVSLEIEAAKINIEAGGCRRDNGRISLSNVLSLNRCGDQLCSDLLVSRIINDNQVVVRGHHAKVISVPASNNQIAITEVNPI